MGVVLGAWLFAKNLDFFVIFVQIRHILTNFVDFGRDYPLFIQKAAVEPQLWSIFLYCAQMLAWSLETGFLQDLHI